MRTQLNHQEGGLFLCTVDLKYVHNLKVESYVFLGGNFRTARPEDSISSNLERTSLKSGEGGARLYKRFCNKAGTLDIKRLLLIKRKSDISSSLT